MMNPGITVEQYKNYIKENEEIQNKFEIIDHLPNDIQRMIYEDYFEGKQLCEEYLTAVGSVECQRLNVSPIFDLTKEIVKHPCIVEYLRKYCKGFNCSYNDHFVKKKKNFVLMNFEESFAMSILMYLYH